MRWLISGTVKGFMMAVFGLVCLAATPILLVQFGTNKVREQIETRWPESKHAQVASYYLGLMTVPIFCCILVVLIWMAVGWLRTKVPAARGEGSIPTRSTAAPVAQSGHDQA